MNPISALSVASEVFPLVKTGGLADVAGALPGALAREDVTVVTLLPGYPAVLEALGQAETVDGLDLFGGKVRLLSAKAGGLDLFVVDAPHLYGREGLPYTGPNGRDWPDNAQRFSALAQMAARIGRGLVPGFVPDVVHAHDWQAGLTPAYLRLGGARHPPTVLTIHNIAFQGTFPRSLLETLGLPPSSFTIDGVEYYGQISFLKAGLRYADRITTVSPTYALEIQTDEGGMGLGGVLRARADVVSGIINGIDEAVWNPAQDAYLVARYDGDTTERRAINKVALQRRLDLEEDPDALLFGVVSRLSGQKGLDLLLEALPVLLAHGGQLALLGAGDRTLEAGFTAAAKAHPGRISAVFGFDEELAHQIQGGCDALLVPSRFEPCGLTQLCALHYGAVPVVARVGGLADTVVDANEMALAGGVATGIQFAPVNTLMLSGALQRAAFLWGDKDAWRRMQRNGMAADVGWSGPARRYASLYKALLLVPDRSKR